MYNFIDVNEVSENNVLPSEALMLNGEYIENLIPGYRTLQVTGREALSAELTTFETGSRDGSVLSGKRYPARYITVKYQLLSASPEAFRAAYNKLAAILNVEEAELIFNDEPDKFFIGTPEEVGEAPGGTNSVVNEFTLYCADPFKYSVTEYEIEPELSDNSFLIDYNGTYKAFPTLEAEFFNENEADADLTGSGDCGYVAFFNEKEKIIQLGDPNEVDTEGYAKSQTLVSQKFNNETAWNSVAQKNWASNVGKLAFATEQKGSFNIAVASWLKTAAPQTSGVLLDSKKSTAARPYIKYSVVGTASERTANSVNVRVFININLIDAFVGNVAPSITEGTKVTLNNTKIYASSTSTSSSGTKTGTYYLWDASKKNGRIRITNTASNIGKSGQVTGWVNVSDIESTSIYAVLGKGCGLKASIQFNGGEWHSVTLKKESEVWDYSDPYKEKIFTVKVKDIEADTTLLEDIRFKVERTDDKESKVGILEETNCKDLEISTYTAPVPETWYLMPETYGTSSGWHGASITRTIPADAAGDVGAKNFTFSYKQKMSMGSSSSAKQEIGIFEAQLISGSGSNRKIVAGVAIAKTGSPDTEATLYFFVNGKTVHKMRIDLTLNNKYFGNNSASKGITTVKTSTITKTGNEVQFNVGGIKKTFKDNAIKDLAATEVTFCMSAYGTRPALSYNGLYWAKLVKNNCDTWEDIPNKFSANDVVTADCKNGEVFLNNTLTPSLGALGNDWEEFFLTPGLNQIGFAYSDWVEDEYAPKFKLKYREVFI